METEINTTDLSLNDIEWGIYSSPNENNGLKTALSNVLAYSKENHTHNLHHLEELDDLGDLGQLHSVDTTHIIDISSFQSQNGEHIANCSLEEFQEKYMCENSPMISYANTPYGSRRGSRNGSRNGSRHGSRNNSDSEDNEDSIRRIISLTQSASKNDTLTTLAKKDNTELNQLIPHSSRPKYEKLTIADVEKSLSKYYGVGDNSSHELDLLDTWLVGIISLLNYSKNLKIVKLWIAMLFSASISSSIAFIVPFTYHDQFWNLVYICGSSALNVIITIILLWSRFDYHVRTFETVISQYQLVRNILDPAVVGENERNMVAVRGEMELQINSINTQFAFVIPSEVSNMYPLLSHTNIFDVIKKIELYRKNLIIKFRDIKNEIRYIIYKWSMNGNLDYIVSCEESKLTNKELKEKKRFLFLLKAKEETKNELLQMRNVNSQLNNLFVEEIKYAGSHKFLYTLSTFVYKKPTPDITIPVLKDYLRLIQ